MTVIAMTNYLEVRNLAKQFGNFSALGDVSLDVLEGEFDLAFDDVPRSALAELWASVRTAHEAWAETRESA